MKSIFASFRKILPVLVVFYSFSSTAQQVLKGKVIDNSTAEVVPFVNVLIFGSQNGATTDLDGEFILEVEKLPATLELSFVGYETKILEVKEYSKKLVVELTPSTITIEEADVTGSRISEKQKQQALTVESMDVIAIREAPSGNFYEGLGNLKGVDLTSAGLGFKVINTRGFNSTSPVRSLQLINGVDNQSPGLNFSLGNFLGASDLDVKKVDIVAGASSAFYGPGAFNGVINMETKDPFYFPGLSASVKVGERSLGEIGFRWADHFLDNNKDYKFGYKINFFGMQANDWEARNYQAIDGSEFDENHPFGHDAVNIYGDEPVAANNDVRDNMFNNKGLSVWYRNGYREEDLVDYSTDNLKFNTGLYYYLNKNLLATYNFSFSTGSTVYQGDNRYRLEDIKFYQNQVEIKNPGKWFVRGYSTNENAGNTYDIVTTALRLQEASGATDEWNARFNSLWNAQFADIIDANPIEDGIVELAMNAPSGTGLDVYTQEMQNWIASDFEYFNNLYLQNVELTNQQSGAFLNPFFEPGTQRFDSLRSDIIGRNFTDGGSRFYDKSGLYHIHGEYQIESDWADYRFGGNYRAYRPETQGTIFKYTLQFTYETDEFGEFVFD